MRKALILTSVLPAVLAVCALSGPAAAQQASAGPSRGQAAGLRYLSWPGKTPPVARVAAAPVSAPTPTPVADAVPLARIAPEPTPAVSRNGLTPASAWTSPRPETAFAMSAPVAYTPAPAPAPAPLPSPLPPPQPAPRAEALPEPAPPPPAVVDPMAPRADAPIFRLQRPAAAPGSAPAADPAYGSSARYYSLHRQAGHAPDAIATPQAVYLDALPVEMTQTPQSADLAEPPAAPSLMRNADGRLMAAPQVEGDSLP